MDLKSDIENIVTEPVNKLWHAIKLLCIIIINFLEFDYGTQVSWVSI